MSRPFGLDEQASVLRVACSPWLDVVSDYDGSLAGFATDPAKAWPFPGAVDVLQRLATTPNTRTVVLTGRNPLDVRRLIRYGADNFSPDENTLSFTLKNGKTGKLLVTGNHGNVADPELRQQKSSAILTDYDMAIREKLIAELRSALGEQFPKYSDKIVDSASDNPDNSIFLEHKTTGVTVHTRSFRTEAQHDAERINDFAHTFAKEYSEKNAPLFVLSGVKSTEISVRKLNKGNGIAQIRATQPRNVSASLIFIGDDITDLSAFTRLGSDDLGVVVGDRIVQEIQSMEKKPEKLIFVDEPAAVVTLLEQISLMRETSVASTS